MLPLRYIPDSIEHRRCPTGSEAGVQLCGWFLRVWKLARCEFFSTLFRVFAELFDRYGIRLHLKMDHRIVIRLTYTLCRLLHNYVQTLELMQWANSGFFMILFLVNISARQLINGHVIDTPNLGRDEPLLHPMGPYRHLYSSLSQHQVRKESPETILGLSQKKRG